MFKRFKILFIFVSIALMAMAQEVSTESLDSIINALELKEVIVTAKKIRSPAIQFRILLLHTEVKRQDS